jgi:hypothetical protein
MLLLFCRPTVNSEVIGRSNVVETLSILFEPSLELF